MDRRLHTIGAVALAGLLAAAGVRAQERFRSGVDLVPLSVVVTDPQGKFVSGLAAGDFTVTEDGIAQEVSFFASTPVPIDLAILLDISASMSDKLATVQRAAVGFTASTRPGDRVTVVAIKDAARVLHPLDEDVTAARAAIRGTTASGNTSLYNALYLTLKDLMKHRRPGGAVRRQAIVLLSDGEDTTSIVSFDDTLELAKQSGVAIYTITMRSPFAAALLRERAAAAASDYAMKALAQQSGARAFFPADIEELAGVYGVIADELANQYLLAYSSSNERVDGAFRRVAVRVDRPGARTRTRSGYVVGLASSLSQR